MAKYVKFKKIIKISVIILLIFIGAVGVFATGTFMIVTAKTKLDTSLLVPSEKSLLVLSANGTEINSFSGRTDTSQIQTFTYNAFIAKEDKRFYSHNGIDYIRILGALKNNLASGGFIEGASTITQQLIKNTHLSQEKTIERKLKEIKLSRELEKTFSKEEILDAYLENIYFGNNCFGIRSASSFYFDKNVDELTLAESAMLAGLISAPSVFNPIADLGLSKSKSKMVLDKMLEQEYISSEDFSLATSDLDNIVVVGKRSVGAQYLSSATREALEILGVQEFPSNAKIVIKTYLNEALQTAMEEMLESEDYKANDTGGAMSGIGSIVIDNSTGGIVAFAGQSEYNLMELKRQPASTIKPLVVYGPALERNRVSPASFILDEPINIDGYTPQNATKLHYGWTTIRDNISRSTNIPAVKLMNELGIENCKGFAEKLGIEFDETDNNLAIALGGMTHGVTIKDLATAYSALSRGGFYCESAFVKEIVINDIVCYTHIPNKRQVMKDSTAYLLTNMLQTVAQTGTGRNIGSLGYEVASKTGTNAIIGFNHDAGIVSYTTEHTAVCWMGNLGAPLNFNSTQFNGSLYTTYFVRDIFKSLYKDHIPLSFTAPASVVRLALDKDAFNHHEVFLADESSTDIIYEMFATDNLPASKPRALSEIDLMRELNFYQSNENFTQVDYGRLIRKYGLW